MWDYEIKPGDVGKFALRINGRPYLIAYSVGRILSKDIGKRVYLLRDSGGFSMESDEQLARHKN